MPRRPWGRSASRRHGRLIRGTESVTPRPWSLAPSVFGAAHASEISHVFGVRHLTQDDPDSESVADGMNRYWANFAAAGDPNGDGVPAQWPGFAPDADLRLQLDPDWQVMTDFRSEACEFWRKLQGAE